MQYRGLGKKVTSKYPWCWLFTVHQPVLQNAWGWFPQTQRLYIIGGGVFLVEVQHTPDLQLLKMQMQLRCV